MNPLMETWPHTTDRAAVLAAVLEHAPAEVGTTIVAHVDLERLDVKAVCAFPTPDPPRHWLLARGLAPDPRDLTDLSDRLREIARGWVAPYDERDPWPTGELVTVVCREGQPAFTEVDAQFTYAWYASRHRTAAFFGDVFTVTPSGWSSLLTGASGPSPALTMPEGSIGDLGGDPAVRDAEALIAEAAAELLAPEARECLACYVHRMLVDHGCDGTLRFVRRFRGERAPRATGLEKRLDRLGCLCDCEVMTEAYEPRSQAVIPAVLQLALAASTSEASDAPPPSTQPCCLVACRGVRRGSTQPCGAWRERRS